MSQGQLVDILDLVAKEPEEWSARVHAALVFWRERKSTYKETLSKFKSRLSSALEPTAQKIDPFVLTDMVAASMAIDSEYLPHFLSGFPVSGVVNAGGTGGPIPGGQRTHGRLANGKVPWLGELRQR